jgi:hypothetical protein
MAPSNNAGSAETITNRGWVGDLDDSWRARRFELWQHAELFGSNFISAWGWLFASDHKSLADPFYTRVILKKFTLRG